MPYGVVVSPPVVVAVAGRRALVWEIAETEAGADDGYAIPYVPLLGRIVLIQARAGAGTIRPEIGLKSGWTVDTLDAVSGVQTAAAYLRVSCALFFVAPARTLFVRSRASVPTDVKTRIAIAEGVP